MTTVLFIVPSLAYSGLARRLTLLATRLPRDRFRVSVAVLGGAAPLADTLRAAGVAVTELGWHRLIDIGALFQLRRLASELRPDVVHAWGDAAVRAALLAGIAYPRALVASGVLPPGTGTGWISRGLLWQIGRIVAFGTADAERYRRLGVSGRRLVEAPLALLADDASAASDSPAAITDDAARVLLAVGPLERHKGFHDAVWMFDILHFLFDDLWLVLAGSGPERARIEEFARVTGTFRRVHCTGVVADLAPWRRRATLAWIPGRSGGVQAALEAMSSGLAVVGFRSPALAEVVVHGETGLLIAPGDKADFARQTRLLLDDETRRRALGQAGRERVAKMFATEPMMEACTKAYSA